MNIQKVITGLIALIGLNGIAISAQAATTTTQSLAPTGSVTLTPNGTITGTLLTANSFVIGAAGGGPVQQGGSAISSPSGFLYSAVYQESAADNPLGGYTFVYQLQQTDNQGVNDGFQLFNAVGFGTSTLPVATSVGEESQANGGDDYFVTAQRPTASTISFSNLQPGGMLTGVQNSYKLVVRTNKTTYGFVKDTVTNGGDHSVYALASNGTVAASVALAPEPGSVAAFGFVAIGLMGLMFRARRGKAQLAL